jgi:hypothetical protein
MATFDFQNWTKRRVALDGAMPRMPAEMRERVEACLAEGCYCRPTPPQTATLTRRLIRASVTVHLQCNACGRSLSGPLSRQQHYNWQSYPLWDADLPARYQAERDTWQAERRVEAAARLDTQSHQHRTAEYREWCRTSPEWHAIVERVLWRCRGMCEACLTERAVAVHHLTYECSKLPPAWHLRGVCRACHDRLHDGDDPWCAPGMARGVPD